MQKKKKKKSHRVDSYHSTNHQKLQFSASSGVPS
jgi:hypothetical protein